MRHRSCHPRASMRPGLTLVETLLALAGTVFVTAAVVMMLTAVSYGTSDRNDVRSHLVKEKTIAGRLGAAIRDSRMVLAAGTDYIVLWMHDNRSNASPNLSEIRLIERNPATAEMSSYTVEFTAGMSDAQLAAADTQYSLAADFRAVTNALKGTDAFPAELWATGLSSLSFSLNHQAAQSASFVEHRIGIGEGSGLTIAVNGAALRNR